MIKKKIMFDCNIFDEIVLDDDVLKLLINTLDRYEYYIIPIQVEELHNIPDDKKTKKEKATVGENFGLTVGDGVTYATSSGVNLEQDKGTNPFIELYKDAPRYAYLNNTFTNKACFEAEFSVSEVLNGDAYPKFGMIFQGKTESLKFYWKSGNNSIELS